MGSEYRMRDHYDFSNGIKNPYADRLKKQITIRLDDQVIEYFKNMAEETGMPYQNIINYYLLDCVKEKNIWKFHLVNKNTKHIFQPFIRQEMVANSCPRKRKTCSLVVVSLSF